jgi:ribosome biogenesis GTPase
MSEFIRGKVIRSTGSWYAVLDVHGHLTNCTLKGKFRTKGIRATNPIAVGDDVGYRVPVNSDTGVIEKIFDRKNYVVRKATKLSKATHIIAANIDQVVVIASIVKPRTSTGFIDRILTTAEAYHIPAVIVFNKFDLYNETNIGHLAYFQDVYENAGYKTMVTSVPDNLFLDDFKDLLKDKSSLIAGHSGVGKSAMINAVDDTLHLKVGQISEYHEKGMHTTTFAEMFKLKFGGYIIDTPGIKEFGLVAFEKAELGQRFPEFRARMHNCKFNNCLHVDEPGCAVINAVENDEIGVFRYQNYLNMLADLSA